MGLVPSGIVVFLGQPSAYRRKKLPGPKHSYDPGSSPRLRKPITILHVIPTRLEGSLPSFESPIVLRRRPVPVNGSLPANHILTNVLTYCHQEAYERSSGRGICGPEPRGLHLRCNPVRGTVAGRKAFPGSVSSCDLEQPRASRRRMKSLAEFRCRVPPALPA